MCGSGAIRVLNGKGCGMVMQCALGQWHMPHPCVSAIESAFLL
jgi:hypothetical protein